MSQHLYSNMICCDLISRQDQLEERLSREASLAIHHEFEVDDEVETGDGFLTGDRLSSNDIDTVSYFQ